MAHLTDMEELLATIPSADIRDYMREAMNCYMTGAYRGCIVLSCIALFDNLLATLQELANLNPTAEAIFTEAAKRRSDQEIYENFLMDQLGSKDLLSSLDATFLATIRTLRNKSTHPSGHKPSPEEARFIYFETITRFLARPIQTAAQPADELVGRLSNVNFFPSSEVEEIITVVAEEVASLQEEDLTQLAFKLVAAVGSADADVARNSTSFIIGLVRLDKAAANKAIQNKLITAKSDDPQYASLILQVLSANGALISGLSATGVSRIRAALSRQIDELSAAAVSESSLTHPVQTVHALAQAMSEADFLATFQPELEKVIDNWPYANVLLQLISERPAVFAIYFPLIIAKAESSCQETANAFASTIATIDGYLAAQCTGEQAFHVVVALMKAARSGVMEAQTIKDGKFAAMPELKEKATAYIGANKEEASKYLTERLSSAKSMSL